MSLKILVIGCGSIGQRHIRNLVQLKAGEIFACDTDPGRIASVKEISDKIVTSTLLDDLWSYNPNVALITVSTALHTALALEAARNGCHLFIEKPLSHNLDHVDDLIAVVQKKHLITFVGYNMRFHDSLNRAKKLLQHNSIGNIVCGRSHFGSYLPDRHPGADYRKGYGAKQSLGGGVILDTLSHHLNYWIFLLGKPKEVFCIHSQCSHLEIDVEDTVEVLLKFADGKVISMHGNSVERPVKHNLEIVGEGGSIQCDFVTNILRFYDIQKKQWRRCYGNKDYNEFYIRELKHFIKCLNERISPEDNIVSGKEELDILLKMKHSNRVKGWVKV